MIQYTVTMPLARRAVLAKWRWIVEEHGTKVIEVPSQFASIKSTYYGGDINRTIHLQLVNPCENILSIPVSTTSHQMEIEEILTTICADHNHQIDLGEK
uniref:Uncharacterized protein n=1 Tax=viral metagenome TaxID=1070528 RepID=A0A6M3KRK2_9ZZZZ